jgi:hypothetical protein
MTGCYADVPKRLLDEFHRRYPVRGALSYYIQLCLEKATLGAPIELNALLSRGKNYDRA